MCPFMTFKALHPVLFKWFATNQTERFLGTVSIVFRNQMLLVVFQKRFLRCRFFPLLLALLVDPFFANVLLIFFHALESTCFFLFVCTSASAFVTGVSVSIKDFPHFRPPGFWTRGSATGNSQIISIVMCWSLTALLSACEVEHDGVAIMIAADTMAGVNGTGAVDKAGTVVAVNAVSVGTGLTGGRNAWSVTADAKNSSSVKMLLLSGNMPLTAEPD